MVPLPGPPARVWDGLAEAAGNIFATRGWLEAWWEAHGGPGEPWVLTDGPDPRVVVPLHVSRRPLRQVRLLGAGLSDELGPACAPADLPLAAAVLRDALRTRRWDVLLLQDVVQEGWGRAAGGRVLRRVPGPVVRLGVPDWEEFLRGRSRNFREQLRRRERRLLLAAPDAVVRTADVGSLEADLETLFALHRARWGPAAPFSTGAAAETVRRHARTALAAGRLRLRVLDVRGRPAAALLGYRLGDVEVFHQSGRDPALDELSVGAVLLARAVRDAAETGAREYRLLRGAEAYKSRWADADRPVETVAAPRTPLGRLAVTVAARRLA